MGAKEVLAQRKKGREKSVPLGDGLSAVITRPPEAHWPALLQFNDGKATWSVGLAEVRKYVVGWDGFTEATFLGAAIGSGDPIPFDAELWDDYCTDNVEAVKAVAEAILDTVVKYQEQRDAVAKNSSPA